MRTLIGYLRDPLDVVRLAQTRMLMHLLRLVSPWEGP